MEINNAVEQTSSKRAHLYAGLAAVCQVSIVLSPRITVVIGTTSAAAAAVAASSSRSLAAALNSIDCRLITEQS